MKKRLNQTKLTEKNNDHTKDQDRKNGVGDFDLF